jgi:hypothetical protein
MMDPHDTPATACRGLCGLGGSMHVWFVAASGSTALYIIDSDAAMLAGRCLRMRTRCLLDLQPHSGGRSVSSTACTRNSSDPRHMATCPCTHAEAAALL